MSASADWWGGLKRLAGWGRAAGLWAGLAALLLLVETGVPLRGAEAAPVLPLAEAAPAGPPRIVIYPSVYDTDIFIKLVRELADALNRTGLVRVEPQTKPISLKALGETGVPPGELVLLAAGSDTHLHYLLNEDQSFITYDDQALRVYVPLFYEYVLFMTRESSDLRFMHETAGYYFFFGLDDTRAAETGEKIYRLMFYRNKVIKIDFPVVPRKLQYLAALAALRNEEVDVVTLFGSYLDELIERAGQDTVLNNTKFLSFVEGHPLTQIVPRYYNSVEIAPGTYPWLHHPLRTLALQTLLFGPNLNAQAARGPMTALSHAFTKAQKDINNSPLVKKRHYRLLTEPLPLGVDWSYHSLTRELFSRENGGCFKFPPCQHEKHHHDQRGYFNFQQ